MHKILSLLKTFSIISSIQTVIIYLYVFFMAHFSSAYEYANYMAITYIVDFTVAISLFGFNLLILREEPTFFKQNFYSYSIIALLIIIIAYSIYNIFIRQMNMLYTILGLILIVFNYLYQILFVLLIKFKKNETAFTIVLINLFFVIIALSICSYQNNLNSKNAIYIRLVQLIILFIISIYSIRKDIIPLKCPSINNIYCNLKKSMAIGGGSILATASQYIDKFVVSTLSSLEIAKYSVARFDIPFIGIFLNNMSYVYMDKIKQAKDNSNRSQTIYYLRLLITYGWYFNVITFTLLFCNSPLIIELLFSKNYLSADYLFKIILFSYLLKILPYTNIIVALGIEKIIIKRILIELILQLVLSLTFSYFWGLTGLAISLVTVLAIWSVPYNLYYYAKTINCKITDLIPIKQMLLFAIKSLIPCIILSYIISYYNYSNWIILGTTTTLIAVFCHKEILFILNNTK